ncbi:MAG: hypothetical protein ACP5G7_12355 [Anaerolineae bacterium]
MTPGDDHTGFIAELNALGEHKAAGFPGRPNADPLTRQTWMPPSWQRPMGIGPLSAFRIVA